MVNAEDVRVLGAWASPYTMRPRIALNLKKVNYEFITETMMPKSELLLKSNPVHMKIPVLFHGDVPICESLVILEYIDETWPSGHSILPADPYDRAIARFWASSLEEKWLPHQKQICTATTEEDRAAAVDQFIAGMEVMEEAFGTCSNGGKWFGGDALGYLDIALGCFLAWTRVTERLFGLKILDGDKLPRLTTWADRFCAHEAVKGVMPETDKLEEFAKAMIMSWKAAPPPK